MSVTVQIPDTSAFMETTIAGISYVSGIIQAGDYVYCCGELGVGKLLKINKNNFADFSILTFANDGKHLGPTDLCYSSATGRIYVVFRNSDTFQLTIAKVNPGTGAAAPTAETDFVDVLLTGDFQVGPGSITVDSTSLYVASFHDNPTQLLKYRLSDGVVTGSGFITGMTQCHCIRQANGKLFASGLRPSLEEAIIARLTTAFTVEETRIFNWAASEFALEKFGLAGTYMWVGNRDTSGTIKRFTQSSLATEADVATNQVSKCSAVDSDGTNIWALFENGRGARINPGNSAVSIYTVNENQGFQREITGDGTYIFTAT